METFCSPPSNRNFLAELWCLRSEFVLALEYSLTRLTQYWLKALILVWLLTAYLDKSGGDEQPCGFRYTANKAQTAGGCAQLARSVCWQHRSELRKEAQDEDTRATCAVSNRGASHAIVLILSGNVPMEVRHDLSDITGY